MRRAPRRWWVAPTFFSNPEPAETGAMNGAYRINFRDPYQRRRRSWWRRLFHLALLAVAAWGFQAPGLRRGNSQSNQVRDADKPTDAIVVLTGGGDRLAEGFRLARSRPRQRRC